MRKRYQLVLAIAAVSLTLAGCGDKDSAAKNGADSVDVGKKAETALTSDNFIKEVTEAQRKAKTSHVDMKIDAAGQQFGAVGDVELGAAAADTKAALKMDMGSGAGGFEMRLIGQAFYINLGPVTDNKYAKVDLTDKSNPVSAQFGEIIDGLDPAKQIDLFKKAMTSVKAEGKAIELDGVKAQPYVITLDTSKIPSIAKLGSEASSPIPKEIVYTMFVGPDSLPRRIATDIAGSGVTVDYSKWGEPVDIKEPPKAEISDKNLLDQMGQTPAA